MVSQKHTGAATKWGIFSGIFRALAKLRFALVVVTALLPAAPSHAETFAFVSATGSGTACTAAQPCPNVFTAILGAFNSGLTSVRVVCLNGTTEDNGGAINFSSLSGIVIDIDCPQGVCRV